MLFSLEKEMAQPLVWEFFLSMKKILKVHIFTSPSLSYKRISIFLSLGDHRMQRTLVNINQSINQSMDKRFTWGQNQREKKRCD